MRFKSRFVNFNTRFVADAGLRTSRDAPPHLLMANEIAVDVGGECWDGYSPRVVIDHHFYREHQFPSASAAVLHNAERLAERFGGAFDTVWLVTHVQPDFDALASAYLVRSLLSHQPAPFVLGAEGELSADGWNSAKSPINWFDPDLQTLSVERRWWVLLASYASHVDNGRRLSCPRNRALHSILYAALKRGRPYLAEDSGAVEFFDEVRAGLERGLNPLTDSVLEGSAIFGPELAFLEREESAYARDLVRARHAVVYLPRLKESFEVFYQEQCLRPLLNKDHHLARPENLAGGDELQPTDGIYLRDPECLLFKEWARLDLENSPSHRGFAFTAVAYSGGRRHAPVNTTDYFFSIDPEAAGDRHLYPVWAALEAEEVKALQSIDPQAASRGHVQCRQGYEGRAGTLGPFFDDPWFDGANYRCTIVATPYRGTVIKPEDIREATRADLTDDPVVKLVVQILEETVFVSQIEKCDLSPGTVRELSAGVPGSRTARAVWSKADGLKALEDAPSGHYRFGTVLLAENVDLEAARVAPQIGALLWQRLYPSGRRNVPADFETHHLLMHPDWIGVWSRHGVMVAHKQAGTHATNEMGKAFTDLVALAGGVESLIGSTATPGAADRSHGKADDESLVGAAQRGDDLMQQVASLRRKLALPEYRLIHRFFDATQLSEVLSLIRDVNIVARQDLQNSATSRSTTALAHMQAKIEWLEVLFISFYVTELTHILFTLLGGEHPLMEVGMAFGVVAFSTGLVAFFLRPWEGSEAEGRRLGPLAVFLVLVWLGAMVYAYKFNPAEFPK